MNLSHIAILNIYGVDYRCIISRVSKSEAINLMQNINMAVKKWNIINHINIDEEIITFGDIEIEKKIFFTAIKVLPF